MNLLKAVMPIALGLGAGYIGQSGGLAGLKENPLAQKLSKSFLSMQGKLDADGNAIRSNPFQTAQANIRPRSVQELTRGGGQTPAQIAPMQQIVASSPRLETAVSNLYQTASNAQVKEMFGMYSQDIPATLRQGRRTIQTKQPGDIQVT